MITLVIARHGNTFEDGEIPRRVGRRTDLALTATGAAQAARLGTYLKAEGLLPDAAWCGTLQRTRETARLALATAGVALTAQSLPMLDEIDYGPDENCTEAEVAARIGDAALKAWEKDGIVPPGWQADPRAIARDWQSFADSLQDGLTALAVTSNGVARFAPAVTGDFAGFRDRHGLKLSTGGLGILVNGGSGWTVKAWNVKP